MEIFIARKVWCIFLFPSKVFLMPITINKKCELGSGVVF